jgi:hypothetical protein
LGSFASNQTYESLFERSLSEENFRATLPWSAAHVAYSLIRPKSQISNIRYDGTLSIGNFMLMMKKPRNFEFEPVPPKYVLLASVVHGISCLFWAYFIRIIKKILEASCPLVLNILKFSNRPHVWT